MQKPIENESIDKLLQNKGSVYENEIIETPNYDYGRSQEPLDFNRLKNKPSGGGNYYSEVTQGNYTTPTVININCGFKPKYIKLTANENGTPGAISHTMYDVDTGISKGFNLSWYGSPATQTNADFSSSQSCLLLDEYNSSNDVRGRIENVGANGFDINLYEVEYSAYVTIIVECFG